MTEEDKDLILEWCGFARILSKEMWQYTKYKATNHWWESTNGERYKDQPIFDLNFYFKYAVPKLGDWICIKFDIEHGQIWAYIDVMDDGAVFSPACSDSAEAFGEALLKLIRSK